MKAIVEAREYLRELWEKWWAIRNREERLILPENAWTYSAVRPANHPHRRMGALAAAVHSFASICRAVESGDSVNFAARFSALHHLFWERHANLDGQPLARATSLVGSDRTLDMLINVFLPARPYGEAWRTLCSLAGPTPSRRILKTLEWLLGFAEPDYLRSAMRQQGLLQLAEDFPHVNAEEVWANFAYAWSPANGVGHVES